MTGRSLSSVCIIGIDVVVDREQHVVRRLTWLLLILVGLSISMVQVTDRIKFLMSNPTTTVVNIPDTGYLPFPKMVLCNQNGYNKTWLVERNLTRAVEEFGRRVFQAHNSSDRDFPNPWYSVSWYDASIHLVGVMGFAGDWSIPLDVAFRPVFPLTELHGCYKFEREGEQVSTGDLVGLILYLRSYTHLATTNPYASTKGFKVLLLPPSSGDPDITTMQSAVMASPGKLTNVHLGLKAFEFLPPPYTDCDPLVTEPRSQ